MAKEFSLTLRICDWFTKYSIYLLAFLMPVFFLPWTTDTLDFNKQALLILFVALALFFWMARVLISGELSVNFNKTHVAVLVLFLVQIVSTIFSEDRYGSFWGWPRITSESFLTMAGIIVLYFIISNVLAKKEIYISVVLLALSGVLSILIGLLQLLGLYVKFNTIGSVAGLGFFAAVFIPLLFALVVYSEKRLKIIFGAGIILAFVLLLFINYQLVWWLVLIGSVLSILFGVQKRDVFDLRWLSVAIFFLALALFFIILKPQMPVPGRPIEVFLNQQATFDIATKTIKDRAIFGSGPGTFAFDFSEYKKVDFNQSILWNARFDWGASKILNVLATTGLLGIISFLALIGAVLFYGIKFILEKQDKSVLSFSVLAGGLLMSFIVQTAGYFLYNSNISLDFVGFFLIASLVGLFSQKRKDYSLKPSSLLTLGVTFIFTSVFIFGIGLLILGGQRYVAETYYFSAEKLLASGRLDEGIGKLERAVSLNPKADIYLTELSQVYLSKAGSLINKKDLSDEEKRNIQILINNSINAAKIATDVGSNNVANWSVRGFIYQNLTGIVPGAEDWAITSYENAIKLEPVNPYFPTQQGVVYMKRASLLAENKADEKNQLLEQAKAQFEKAIQLKSDYSPARFQIAMVYQQQGKTAEELQALEDAKKSSPNDIGLAFQIGIVYYQLKDYEKAKTELERAVVINPNYSNALYFLALTYFELGQKNKAIEKFAKVAELNPGNQDLKKIIDNLNSGRKPLEGIVQETPPEAPIPEKPEETNK